MKSTLNVLLVDDEIELRKSVASFIEASMPDFKLSIAEASTGLEAIDLIRKNTFDLVLMDVRMPEMDGLTALEKIKSFDSRTFIVIMTAHSNLQDAINAIKIGAYDYLEKPVEPKKLTEIIYKALDAQQLVSEMAYSTPIFDDDIDTDIVGRSAKMKEVYNLIRKLCEVDTTVLIRGENGTGKELVARAIHFNSPRKHGEFVAINCGAIPENLMESEIFGHEKGAFTGAVGRKIGKFQLANNGTLFLDEIGELKPELQVKLLRVLQEKRFTPVGGNREVTTSARVIAATNRNLEKMIEDGGFREDLFYRLNVMPIYLPPLRDRVQDIEVLVSQFIEKFNGSHEQDLKGIEPSALEKLINYNWPGNIRELENVIERSFIVGDIKKDYISLTSLPENIQKTKPKTHIEVSKNYSGPMDFDVFKERTEKDFIIHALKSNEGRINKTVAQANIPKNTLLRKIKKYGINVKELIKK